MNKFTNDTDIEHLNKVNRVLNSTKTAAAAELLFIVIVFYDYCRFDVDDFGHFSSVQRYLHASNRHSSRNFVEIDRIDFLAVNGRAVADVGSR